MEADIKRSTNLQGISTNAVNVSAQWGQFHEIWLNFDFFVLWVTIILERSLNCSQWISKGKNRYTGTKSDRVSTQSPDTI